MIIRAGQQKMEICKADHRVRLCRDVYKLTFKTDKCRFTRPGQYALLNIDGEMRPYQVCDYDSNRFTIVFRESGQGGRTLNSLEFGDELESMTGLGNGFNVDEVPDKAVLVADSMGVSEMLELARSLLMKGKSFRLVLGYPGREDMFMVDSFRNICNDIEVITRDGSNGREGLASDAVRNAEYVCASGSAEMLRSLSGRTRDGQFSLSDVMLTVPEDGGDFELITDGGKVRCSEEGPVFDKNYVHWDSLGA